MSESNTSTIEMQDGSTVTFGANSNVVSTYDGETSNITFKLRDGNVISWDVEGTESMSLFQKTVYLYGLFRRIKSAIAGRDLDKLAGLIEKQIEALKAGKFVVRGADGVPVLDNFLKAFATVMSGKFPGAVAEKNVRPHWVDLENPSVVTEVTEVWEAMDKKVKTAVRKNPFIVAVKAEFDREGAEAIDF